MQTVEVRIAADQLPQQMAAMRSWLDQHRFEPTTFSCDETPSDDIRVSITFGSGGAATAFAARFMGRLQHVRAEATLGHETPPPSDLIG